MTLYRYRCPNCGEMDIRHPMSEVDQPHACPQCGAPLKRVFVPLHHWWPAQYRPGFEHSGQRLFLDPERQARKKDEFAQKKEEHLNREAAMKKAQENAHAP